MLNKIYTSVDDVQACLKNVKLEDVSADLEQVQHPEDAMWCAYLFGGGYFLHYKNIEGCLYFKDVEVKDSTWTTSDYKDITHVADDRIVLELSIKNQSPIDKLKQHLLGVQFKRVTHTKSYNQYVHDMKIVNGETVVVDQHGVTQDLINTRFYVSDDNDVTLTLKEYLKYFKIDI